MRPENIKSIPFSGYSMYPTIRPGDTLIVKKVNGIKGNVKLGDIVCLPDKKRYIAHRIIKIRESEKVLTITTKGDNMVNPDDSQTINSDGILKVVMIKRGSKGFIKPRFDGVLARLSSLNLTFGIIKGRMGKSVKRFIGR